MHHRTLNEFIYTHTHTNKHDQEGLLLTADRRRPSSQWAPQRSTCDNIHHTRRTGHKAGL